MLIKYTYKIQVSNIKISIIKIFFLLILARKKKAQKQPDVCSY